MVNERCAMRDLLLSLADLHNRYIYSCTVSEQGGRCESRKKENHTTLTTNNDNGAIDRIDSAHAYG